MAKANKSLKKTSPGQSTEIQAIRQKGDFFRQNKTFRDNAKKFYRKLGNKAINIQNPPSLEKVASF